MFPTRDQMVTHLQGSADGAGEAEHEMAVPDIAGQHRVDDAEHCCRGADGET